MESTMDPDDARRALLAVERASAAPFVDYPPTPWWYSPGFGAWFAALVAVNAFDVPNWTSILVVFALIALLGVFVGWYTRTRGAWPTLTNAPAGLKPVLIGYLVGVVVLAAIIVPLIVWTPPIVSVIATFVLVTAGIAVYEVAYDRAAARTRERLA